MAVAERKNLTFVFVTPRNWPGKDAWAKEKAAKKRWKDVKALDASDLEQWLEQSVPAQSWLAEKIGNRPDDILSRRVLGPLVEGDQTRIEQGVVRRIGRDPQQRPCELAQEPTRPALSGNLGLWKKSSWPT